MWWVELSSVLGALLLVTLLPYVIGALYRKQTIKCDSSARLEGKTAIVTGASAGLGMETARFLAGRGARVIMACNNLTKSRPIADGIIAATGNQEVVARYLDVSDLTSVRKFADQIIQEEKNLHILINNAGIYPHGPKRKSPQGFELTLATNYFGCFLLTNLLLDKLKASAPSRIVVVSSALHRINSLRIDDLNYEHRLFINYTAYCQSKLCNLLFTRELARRLEGTGENEVVARGAAKRLESKGVTANCLHPGLVATEIFDNQTIPGKISGMIAQILGRTRVQGIQTIIYLALSEDVEGKSGAYYDNSRKSRTYFKANDMDLASRLWEQSCKDVGLAN